MRLRILVLAYPLIPVGPEACGGTEQVLYRLLDGLSRPPWNEWVETVTLAHDDSCVPGGFAGWGQLARRYGIALPAEALRRGALLSPDDLKALEEATNRIALNWLSRNRVDLVHNQGAAFVRAAGGAPVPVLFTLHLPRSLYRMEEWGQLPPNLVLQCVSRQQHRAWRQSPGGRDLPLAAWIRNGIALDEFTPARDGRRGEYLLYAGRMAPEKGPHVAMEVARQTGRALLLLGEVYPFPSHQAYFHRKIEPGLGEQVAWRPAPTFEEKRAWLAGAAAVVIPSQVEETSSLIAMEAAASGVPVLAFRRGALPETVVHGRTGYLCETVEQMVRAAGQLGRLQPRNCRQWAEANFDSARMVSEYVDLYRRLVRRRSRPADMNGMIPEATEGLQLTQNGRDG